jgi:hypothetical protein
MQRFITEVASVIVLLFALLFGISPQPAPAMEKMTNAELRKVTGKSGFINSKKDLKTLETAKNHFQKAIKGFGLQNFLSKEARQNLLGKSKIAPEQQAKLLQKSTRNLLTNRKFLRTVERTGKAFAQLAKSIQQLQSLQ